MKTRPVRQPSMAKAKPRPKRVSGFIVRDDVGILAIVPAQYTLLLKAAAFLYAEDNTIIKAFLSRKNEDVLGFCLRLGKLARQMQQAGVGR